MSIEKETPESAKPKKTPAKKTAAKTTAKAPAKTAAKPVAKAAAAPKKSAAKAAPAKKTPAKSPAPQPDPVVVAVADPIDVAQPVLVVEEVILAPAASSSRRPTFEEIAYRAYFLFLERNCEHGHHESDWHRAERELLARF